jgi:hypothetical protein
MLARPVTMHQLDVLGIGFIKRGIVDDQKAALSIHMLLGLVLERAGARFEALQQAREGIMGSATWAVGLDTRRFSRRDHLRRGNQEIDVVEIGHFGRIHRRMIPHNLPTA